MLHTSLDWTPFGQYMIDFIKRDKPRPGNTAKESERNIAVHRAEIEMIAQGLAYLGTAERITKLTPLMNQVNEDRKWVQMVEQHTVSYWLRTVRERWDNGEFKELSDDEWLRSMQEEYTTFVFDDAMLDVIFRYRKQLVLAGVIDPDPDDADWLRKEHENLTAVANPYEQALAKLKG